MLRHYRIHPEIDNEVAPHLVQTLVAAQYPYTLVLLIKHPIDPLDQDIHLYLLTHD